jgi:site-specific DNA-cytosine methylase
MRSRPTSGSTGSIACGRRRDRRPSRLSVAGRAVNVLSLFSGIGAHDLGLERAGMRTVAFCESDPWCRAVLAKHWPGVPRFDDVRALAGSDVPGPVDLVTGGFPCQDISSAGRRQGLGGKRSGLWFEYLRLVQELRPLWVVAENVSVLRARGFDDVAAGLEENGYAVWPVVVGAWAVGAPHRRERVWIVARLGDAYRPRSARRGSELGAAEKPLTRSRRVANSSDAHDGLEPGRRRGPRRPEAAAASRRSVAGVANAADGGAWRRTDAARQSNTPGCGARLANPDGERELQPQGVQPDESGRSGHGGPRRWPAGRGAQQFEWEAARLVEPGLGRAAAGPTEGMDLSRRGRLFQDLARRALRLAGLHESFARQARLRALGNANPPHVPEAIGRWILTMEQQNAQEFAA